MLHMFTDLFLAKPMDRVPNDHVTAYSLPKFVEKVPMRLELPVTPAHVDLDCVSWSSCVLVKLTYTFAIDVDVVTLRVS
jgi:hypothetical protein